MTFELVTRTNQGAVVEPEAWRGGYVLGSESVPGCDRCTICLAMKLEIRPYGNGQHGVLRKWRQLSGYRKKEKEQQRVAGF